MSDAPLDPAQLDDIENWAKAAADDDPDDEFPRLIVRLVKENSELRQILLADSDGQLLSLKNLSDVNDQLEKRVQEQGATIEELTEKLRKEKEAKLAAEQRLQKYNAVLHKVEVLLNIARTRMSDDGMVGAVQEIGDLTKIVNTELDKRASVKPQKQGKPKPLPRHERIHPQGMRPWWAT